MTGADRVNKQRADLVDTISAELHDLKQGFIDGSEGCNISCRTMHLGVLVRTMREVGVLNHLSENRFQCFSLSELVNVVEAIQCPRWCDMSSDYYSGGHRVHQCVSFGRSERTSFQKYTSPLISRVKSKMGGLQLADFVSSSSVSK